MQAAHSGAVPRPLLEVTAATVSLGGRAILRGTELSVFPGEILVLLGPNGAGKSTLVRAISGRLRIDAGSVRIDGRDPVRDPDARRLTGIVPQQIAVFEKLTAAENLAAFGRLMGLGRREAAPRAREVLAQMGLAERAQDRVSSLSGGMRRRVNIGAALMHRPRLLVLDEPTVGVDVEARAGLADVLRRLRSDGFAILLTTHDLEEADALADRVAIMVAGRIADAGKPIELVERLYGGQRELTVGLGEAASRRSQAIGEVLGRHGLAARAGGRQWTGVIDASADTYAGLVQLAFESAGAIEDVRVRRPGLEAVLTEHMLRAGATLPAGREA